MPLLFVGAAFFLPWLSEGLFGKKGYLCGMNARIRSIARWSRRYIRVSFVLMVGVLAYVMLFSDNSVIDNYQYQMEIDKLRSEIRECTDSIIYYENLNRRLRTDPATMERIVREQYHMQRKNEDIYIVE